MKGLIPFASLTISGPGAATLALSTSAAQFTLFASAGGANGPANTYDDGDPAVKPDYANNRILVEAPGVYKVSGFLTGVVDGAADITIAVAKNGTAVADLTNKQRWGTTKNTHAFGGLLNVTAADNPGTIATKPDPSSSGFAGAGGFPKMLVPLTILLTAGAGTPTITAEGAQFVVERIG